MRHDKATSVAVIYQCSRISEPIIRNRPKLQRRLCRAIEDMVEDGFINFILPIERENPFATTFIDALLAERSLNPNIHLTIALPTPLTYLSAAEYNLYTKCADEIIHHTFHLPDETASAVIIYFERNCSQLHSATHHAQRNQLPLININL